MYSLGIDASTQSCSALVIDPAEGRIVAEASVNFGERLPRYGSPSGFIPDGEGGEVHSDPCMWLDALELLLADLAGLCDLSKISVVSGAGQQHGSVYLNDGWWDVVGKLDPARGLSEQLAPCLSRATSPIWMDGSTTEECREITVAVGGESEVCKRTGSIAIERFTGPQIRRFSKNDPKGYAATERIHLVSSFLCSVLCGRDAAIDTGDGAGMNLLNLSSWDWDDRMLEATAEGLRSKLPEVVQGNHVAGTVSPFFRERFGFSGEVPVTVFTGDNPSSLVGMGAARPGKVVVSLGTSDTFFAAMPEVASDPDGFGHVFGNPWGGSMSLQCFINGSLAREAVKDRFGMSWAEFESALESTPVGNDGNLMLPFFRPEISPRVDLDEPKLAGTSEFVGWNNAAAAVRACVEGQFLNMRGRTRWMKLAPQVIFLTGGAAMNNAIAQVVADVFACKVQRLKVGSSVALGGAIRAAVSGGLASFEDLEGKFCQPEQGSGIEPADHLHRAAMLEGFEDLLSRTGFNGR